MNWVPKASYGAGPTVLAFTYPIDAFKLRSIGVGAGDEAASGIGAAIQIRRDQIAVITLRFLDSEYDAVEAYANWLQENRHLTHDFWFDQNDDDTMRTVRLHGPHLGEAGFEPERRAFDAVWDWEYRLRSADFSRFGINWSGR